MIKKFNEFLKESNEYDDLSYLIGENLNLIQTIRGDIYLGSMSRRDKFHGEDVEIYGVITSVNEYRGSKSNGIWVEYESDKRVFLKYDKREDLFYNGDSFAGSGATDTFIGITEKDNEILNSLKEYTIKN